MKRIVWLASYPKSGNTWFRAFLANLLRDPAEPVNINELETGPIASARPMLDLALGYDSSNLTFDEIDRLRRELYLRQAGEEGPALYLKVHDAYSLLTDGRPLFPPEATQAVLYLVRNPLDVCVSYAHHGGRSDYRRTLESMCNPKFEICGKHDRFHEQLRQRMFSWSGHVASWRDSKDHRVHVMRYEDMKRTPVDAFTATAKFLGLPDTPARIQKAIDFSRFEELKKQEEKSGFRERMHTGQKFFRKGTSGSWREALTEEQARRMVDTHRETMTQLGYLDSNGQLVY